MKTILAAMAALMLLAAPAAAQSMLDHVPADSEVVAAVRVADLMAQPVVQEIWDAELRESPIGAGVRLLGRLSGIDILTDIEEVLVAGNIERDQDGMLALRGDYDQEALLDLLMMNPTYGRIDLGGRTVHRWMDEGDEKLGLFHPSGDVVIANSSERLRHIIQVLDGGRPSYASAHPDAAPSGAAAWARVVAPPTARCDLHRLMDNIGARSFEIVVRFDGDGAVVHSTATPRDAAHAADFAEMLAGLVALGRVQNQEPALREVARATSVEAGDSAATAATRIDRARLRAMVLRLLEQAR